MWLDSTSSQLVALVGSFTAGWFLKSRGSQILAAVRQISSPEKSKLVLVVRADLRMSAGKVASQCAHAAVSCYKQTYSANPKLVRAWEAQGQPKIVLRANQPGEQGLTGLASMAAQAGVTAIIVRDAGRTEVASGSATVLGIGPGDADKISKLTESYRLF